jgi:uncharacterized membrane protein
MKISLTKYPVGIILCILWSMILLLLVLFWVQGPLRIIFGLPFVFFVPGYIVLLALFPQKKSDTGINNIERFIFSIGISIAFVSLFGLLLNYTPWGIRLEPVILILSFFIFTIGPIALFRWTAIIPEERFRVFPDFPFLDLKKRFNNPINIIFAVLIILPIVLAIYSVSLPKTGEIFTEFYVLGPTRTMDHYPNNLSVGENATVILGIFNHEYRTINYTVGIWLVNQSTYYNNTIGENITVIHHMWFLDNISVELNHASVDVEKEWNTQWEYPFSFHVSQKGHFKLVFLLFLTPLEHNSPTTDYGAEARYILESAYRQVHLWITVN